MKKPEPKSVDEFLHFQKIPTRWMDNDVYQHVNNVIYYSFFDTVVNHYLIDKGLLNINADFKAALCHPIEIIKSAHSNFEKSPFSF